MVGGDGLVDGGEGERERDLSFWWSLSLVFRGRTSSIHLSTIKPTNQPPKMHVSYSIITRDPASSTDCVSLRGAPIPQAPQAPAPSLDSPNAPNLPPPPHNHDIPYPPSYLPPHPRLRRNPHVSHLNPPPFTSPLNYPPAPTTPSSPSLPLPPISNTRLAEPSFLPPPLQPLTSLPTPLTSNPTLTPAIPSPPNSASSIPSFPLNEPPLTASKHLASSGTSLLTSLSRKLVRGLLSVMECGRILSVLREQRGLGLRFAR